MGTAYKDVKTAAIDVIDDFSPSDIVKGYSDKFDAMTKLAKIGLSDAVLAVMPPRVNKVMKDLCGSRWRNVGAIDTVGCGTIGDFISLVCKRAKVGVPEDEPK